MIYILLLIVTFKTVEGMDTHYLFNHFEDKQDCEVIEGKMLTEVYNDPDVVGWIMPQECEAVNNVPKKA